MLVNNPLTAFFEKREVRGLEFVQCFSRGVRKSCGNVLVVILDKNGIGCPNRVGIRLVITLINHRFTIA